jgi:3-deoxy-D-manno-octulosonate 8-phosphate phosphatase (KDO 8-P phosphatase)
MISQAELLKRAAGIKLVIFDVDGVMTDGKLYFDAQGGEQKIFHVHDGLGIKLLQQSGVKVAVISSRSSLPVQSRLENLGIAYIYQGQENKITAFNELLENLQLTPAQIAYVGDDLPDLPLICKAGLGIAVANAVALVKQYAFWHTRAKGGEGAVREVCEIILQAQGTLLEMQSSFLVL